MIYQGFVAVLTVENGLDSVALSELLSRPCGDPKDQSACQCIRDRFQAAGVTVLTVGLSIEFAKASECWAADIAQRDADSGDSVQCPSQLARKGLTHTQLKHFLFCLLVTVLCGASISNTKLARQHAFDIVQRDVCKAQKLGKRKSKEAKAELAAFLDAPYSHAETGPMPTPAPVPRTEHEAAVLQLRADISRAEANAQAMRDEQREERRETRAKERQIAKLEEQLDGVTAEWADMTLELAEAGAALGRRAMGLIDELHDLRDEQQVLNKSVSVLKSDAKKNKAALTRARQDIRALEGGCCLPRAPRRRPPSR